MQAFVQRRILQHENLEHALAPTRALANEGRKGFGLKSSNKRLVNERAGPALRVKFEGGFAVFGDGNTCLLYTSRCV